LDKLHQHPRAAEFYLLIACYQFAIDHKEAAKEYLQLFENTGMGIANFNYVLQSYYNEMKEKL